MPNDPSAPKRATLIALGLSAFAAAAEIELVCDSDKR
jgi:hypothetical protein